jgi:multiple sugar transport system permease protein
MFSSLKTRRKFKKIITLAILFFYILLVLLPLYWVVLTSMRTENQVYRQPDRLVPRDLTFENYAFLIAKRPLPNWLQNSLIVVGIVTLTSLIISIPASYSLARLKYRGAETIGKTVLFMYLLPQSLLYIPLFILLNKIDLINRLGALFIAYPTFTLPFCTWMLLGYFKTIPVELEDSARIDGCNRIQVLTKIVLPLAMPGVITAAIFSMAAAWNEFLYALVFINSDRLRTIQVGIAFLRRGDTILWGPMMAGAVFATIPPVLLYMFLQRYVVEGLTAGSVKG